MSKCSNCGLEFDDKLTICPQCGAAKYVDTKNDVTAEKEHVEEAKNISENKEDVISVNEEKPISKPQVNQQQSKMTSNKKSVDNGTPFPKPISTAGFFWTMFLFGIPVIGWIICVLTAFIAKNDNRRNFARANLIWLLIFIIIAVAGVIWYFIFGKEVIGQLIDIRLENRLDI